jgi:hypothetical protein
VTPAVALPAPATALAAAVPEREYLRLLGLPRGRALEGELLDRANGARAWYAGHGHPFVATRRVALREVGPTSVTLETGAELRSTVLADRLRAGEGHALVVLAASAGCEVADEAARLWATDRPDEAFFLDRFAVAVTERLVFWASATICRASEPAGETLLPHLSPGCGHWDLADQHRLMALLTGEDAGTILGPIALLPSGALRPQHSVLAALGVTHRPFAATPEDLCRSCDLDPCAFRRAPFTAPPLRLLETR